MTSPMFDYTAITPTDETLREYTFDMIPGEPSVWMAPATDENKRFQSERIRLQIEDAETTTARVKGQKLKAEDLIRQGEESLERDRVLLARCCAKSWGKAPTATDGTQPECNEANALAFFRALPDYMFRPFNNWAGNIYNFVDRPVRDAAALGNESPPA